MKNKHLVLIFLLVFLLGWLAGRFTCKQTEGFKKEIIRLDSASVSQIILENAAEKEVLVFDKNENGWVLTREARTIEVKPEQIGKMLGGLSSIRTISKFQTPEEQWANFGLGKKEAVHVRVFGQGVRKEEFFLRRCTEKTKGVSFLRLAGSPEVYQIENDLSCLLDLRFSDFRKPQDIDFQLDKAAAISLSWPDAPPFFIEKIGEGWFLPGKSRADKRLETEVFLQNVLALKNLKFADDFDETNQRELFLGRLKIEFAAGLEPVEISCFRSEKPVGRFVLLNSAVPGEYFYSNDSIVGEVFLPEGVFHF